MIGETSAIPLTVAEDYKLSFGCAQCRNKATAAARPHRGTHPVPRKDGRRNDSCRAPQNKTSNLAQ